MRHSSITRTGLFVLSLLLVTAVLTACGQRPPSPSEGSSTRLPSTAATTTLALPTYTSTSVSTDSYHRGVKDQEAGNLESAIEEFGQAIAHNPNYADAYFERGRTYALQGSYALAIADWSQVIALDPDRMDAYWFRAFAYDDSGQYVRAIADFDKVLEVDPQYGEAYYWRGVDRARIGEADIAVSDLEHALTLSLDPDIEEAAQEVLNEQRQLIAGQITFDGYWSGNTAQGEVIAIEIVDNGVVWLSIGFNIPGCESLSPLAVSGGGEPSDFVDRNRFVFRRSTGFAALTGTFTSSSTAIGTVEISCGSGLDTTWSATKGAQAVRTPTPNDLAKIPQIEISDGLFSPADGADNLDEFTAVDARSGDWLLTWNFSESIMPIPSGWESISTPDGAHYLFRMEGAAQEYSINIQVGRDCRESETTEEFIAEVEQELGQANRRVLKREIVDVERAYLLVGSKQRTETALLQLIVVSQPAEGCYFYLLAETNEADWGAFYPIIRAVVANWYDRADNFLGVALPERLPETTN